MTVNTRLQENPLLQKMPTTQREWVQYQNELAKWVRYVVKLGDGSITTSGGTTISGLDEIPGRVISERSLPMTSVVSATSIQDAVSGALTSFDGGASATIAVAAHALKTPTGDINYNSGSVTGLSYNTQYFVYTDDEDFAGGAVTYVATTDPEVLVGDLGRYYVGELTTAVQGTSGNMSGVTKGSPTTITMSAAHGWSSGDTVSLSGIVDDLPDGDLETALNGNAYTITVTSTTEFTVPEDTSALTNVYVSGGTATRTNTTATGGYGGALGTRDERIR